jgi:putative endopeptidase
MSRQRGDAILVGLLAMVCWRGAGAQLPVVPAAKKSGIETQYFDHSVRPQDDFYQYVNGKWLASMDIPPDRPAYGTATKLFDDAQRQLREIIEETAKNPNLAPGSDEWKIGALYNSFLDEARIEQLDSKPLASELARIDAIASKRDIAALIAHLQQIAVIAPYSVSVHLDSRDSSQYVLDVQQDGLGLPDRDYYLRRDATTLRLMLNKYQLFIAGALTCLGDKNATQEAAAIVALETELAKSQWSKTDSQDPVKTYNRIELANLDSIAPGYDWQRYLSATGAAGKLAYLIVSEPSYLRTFGRLLTATPLATWKAYFRWHLLSDYSPYLSKAYVDAAFAFYSTTLQGVPQNQPRWRRGVMLVDQAMGQGLGRLYVARHFSAQSKAGAERLVDNLLAAFRQDLAQLDWMTPETRQQALLKLSRITIKIGYPDQWRDYSTLALREDDLVGNVMRAETFDYRRNIDKLGRAVDKTDWETTPQAVNASYNPQMNEIVFPAAILQPPFFDATAEDAVNYGGIGMIIGHEISHAFDDQGSQYDGDGRLRDWWTAEDHARFAARTAPLISEYSGFMPLRGRRINGAMTLNENIADNAGLAIAYKAYGLSLSGGAAPLIDGLTGDQRFFMGFAQAWREKIRDSYAIEMIQSDPHAISFVRVIGTLINQAEFYVTFDVRPGDRMYIAPDQRVVIW